MAEGGRKAWEQKLQEVGAKVEDDLRRVVAYINDEVVPDIRHNSSQALHAAAAELHRLAQRMDESGKEPSAPPPAHGESSRKP